MYTKVIPHKNFKGKPRNQEVQFNLTEHEVLKLLVEFKEIFDWQEQVSKRDPEGEIDTAEVIDFYNNFEAILLAAWGELDESGDHFKKGGVYEFKESSVFHAAMKLFLEDQAEANRLIDGLMPKGLQDMVKKAGGNLEELAEKAKNDETGAGSADLIARLMRERDEALAKLPADSPTESS
jgi:hypothetical protein